MERFWRVGSAISVAVLAILVVVGLLVDSNDAGGSSTATPGDDVSLEEQAKSDLTVRPSDILPAARCQSDEFLRNSLVEVRVGNPAYRQWSDAVSIPFASSDKDEMFGELMAEHCGNPTELDMSIRALGEVTVGDFNVGENNPWMGKFEQAADAHGLRRAFLTHKKGEKGIFVTPEYQEYAAMANSILMAFQNTGVHTLASVSNWHQPGPVAGELPRAVLNPVQENLPALVFEYTAKGQCPLVRIGYNIADRRFEGFPPPTCQAPPAPPERGKPSPGRPPTPTTPTGPPTPSTTPTTRGCPSGKCKPSEQQPTPSTTAPPASTPTTRSENNSGPGAPPNGIVTPPTSAPPATPPPTSTPPTSRVEY